MVSACKGGSSRSITAVMPYFPYSRQSKKKSHRGSITARMVANLLNIAGVTHVITIDLHASQMQGFFKCPVDNLIAEPLLARWIRHNLPNWKEAVVVSKNPGGTKRVTSLADALKLSFGIVTTDRRRAGTATPWNESAMMESLRMDGAYDETPSVMEPVIDANPTTAPATRAEQLGKSKIRTLPASNPLQRRANGALEPNSSPLHKSMRASSIVESEESAETIRANNNSNNDGDESHDKEDKEGEEESADEYTDEVCLLSRTPVQH
jgi:ribose-phosphate pyrophosphokinase